MSTSERKIKHRQEVRASIMEAAEDLVLKDGWEALSIRKIAEAIDYSVPVIYDHFINKEALLLEFVRRGFDQMNNSLAAAKKSVAEPELQIRAIAYAYLNFSQERKEYYRLMFGLGIPSCEEVNKIPELNRFVDIVIEPINSLVSIYPDKKIDTRVKFKRFWSALHGMISIEYMDLTGKNNINKKVLEDFLENFLAGIKN